MYNSVDIVGNYKNSGYSSYELTCRLLDELLGCAYSRCDFILPIFKRIYLTI